MMPLGNEQLLSLLGRNHQNQAAFHVSSSLPHLENSSLRGP
jgi:hypothetical protein